MSNTTENKNIVRDVENEKECRWIIVPNISAFFGGWRVSPNPVYSPKRKSRKAKRR